MKMGLMAASVLGTMLTLVFIQQAGAQVQFCRDFCGLDETYRLPPITVKAEPEFKRPSPSGSGRGSTPRPSSGEPGPGSPGAFPPQTVTVETSEGELLEVELSEEDVISLRQIATSDKVVGDLLKEQKWAAAVSQVLKMVVKGPAKIVLIVADSQIDAWGKLNAPLEPLAKVKTCERAYDRETEAMGDNRDGVQQFWSKFRRSRGCD